MAEGRLTESVDLDLVVTKKRRTTNQLEDEERWNALSTIVALEGIANGYHESHVDYSKGKGSLVVIGSGIKCVGQFSLEAISHLKNADKVLYCVADPATEHFIRDLCPDAFDLYVLYANGKKRYETYVQMAEVSLYYARQGLRTVMVFYGHPGIFVMPSHRCIQIAQQQGIETYMLPAVSALDCLVADLGIDPSYPGMMTLEATDLLLRNRNLSTDMHVILWQVGCVGDLGFNRTGFENQHFPVLIEHIQGIYGNDYVITHYIGAQYPMCSPTIAQLQLSKILEPDTIKTITGMSTFYIPPKQPKEILPAVAEQLDITLASDDSTVSPLVRQFARCGPSEKKAIHDLLDWKVPDDYKHYTFTKIGQYICKIAQDVGLLQEHQKAPVKIMKDAGLAANEMSAMTSSNQIRTLMKTDADSVATQVVVRMLTDPEFASALNDTINKYIDDPQGEEKVNQWLAFKGYNTTLTDVKAAYVELKKTNLLPWTGKYTTNQSITLTIVGQAPDSTSASKVWVDTTEIKNFTFTNQTLTWSSSNGNSSSAELIFVDGGENNLSFTGKYWSSTSQEPTAANISGHNSTTTASFSSWVGSYTSTLNSMTGPEVTVSAVQNSSYRVFLGNTEISHYSFGSDNVLLWSDSYNTTNGSITFSVENAGTPQVRRIFSGYYWGKGSTKTQTENFTGIIKVTDFTPYIGMYRSYYADKKGKSQYGDECFLTNESNSASFTIGTTAIKSPKYSNSTITWSTSGGNADNGTVTFYIDAENHISAFKGRRWTGSTEPAKINFWGTLDTTYLKEWAAIYTTYSKYDDSWSPGAQITVNSATTPSEIQVTYGSTAIKSPVFNNPILTWSANDGNSVNAYIVFYYPTNSSVPQCFGKIWLSDSNEPSKSNFKGEIDTKYLQSWTGAYTTYFKDDNNKYTVDAPKLSIFGGLTESASTVYVGGQAITNFTYSTEGSSKYGYLKWSDSDNATGGDITFYVNDSLIRSFTGFYWTKGNSKPSSVNWAGDTNPPSTSSGGGYAHSSGGANFWTAKNIGDSIAMGMIVMGVIVVGKIIWDKYGTKLVKASKERYKKLQKKFKRQEEEVDNEDPYDLPLLQYQPPNVNPNHSSSNDNNSLLPNDNDNDGIIPSNPNVHSDVPSVPNNSNSNLGPSNNNEPIDVPKLPNNQPSNNDTDPTVDDTITDSDPILII